MSTSSTIFIHKKAFNWNKTFEDFLRMKPFNNQLKARLYNASVEYYLSNNTETEDRELIVFYNHGDVTTIFNYEYFEGGGILVVKISAAITPSTVKLRTSPTTQ